MAYLKENAHFKILYSQVAQQIIHSVAESFKSFNELTSKFFQGELAQKPKLPNYRKKGGMALFTYPKQSLKFNWETGLIRLPLGNEFKSWFNIDAVYLPMPTNLKFSEIRELRILPRNRCFYAEFVYEQPVVEVSVDKSKVLGIDPGLNNWLTCVSNVGTSFIIDGRHVKSLNRWYNKQVSVLKEKKPQGFWSNQLAFITEKRNRQMRDAVNKAARLVISHCLSQQIGTIVFGWNQQNKDGIELGKNNQSFVQIPTARLKERISQLCKQYGIQFIETEESYTSQASFLDNDLLPTYGERPKEQEYKPSGKRVKRGLYRTANNWYINADCNGAANIIRKVSTTLDLDLSGVSRGSLTTPQRIKLWSAKMKRSNVVLTRCLASF